MNKRDRDLVKQLEALGFGYDRTNTKGVDFYVHEDTGHEIKFMPGVDERGARSALRAAQHMAGVATKDNKRNASAIRARQEVERGKAERELVRLREHRAALAVTDEQAVRDAEDIIRRAERKFKYWDSMVREATGAFA